MSMTLRMSSIAIYPIFCITLDFDARTYERKQTCPELNEKNPRFAEEEEEEEHLLRSE